MSEPLTPVPPSDPRPFRPEAPASRGGCSKPLWIGCGALIVLLGISVLVMVVKAKDLFAWAMGQLQAQVVSALPPEMTPEERSRLEKAFSVSVEKVRAGTFDAAKLQSLQGTLQHAASEAGAHRLTRDEALKLLNDLEAFAGIAPTEGGETAAPEGNP